MEQVQMLCVCTANICRSPATAGLLRSGLAPLPMTSVVSSGGTAAGDGFPACPISVEMLATPGQGRSATWPARDADAHRSRAVTRDDAASADLILSLDRSHRGALARLDPRSRQRTFTLRQAAVLAEGLRRTMDRGDLPEGAPELPAAAEARFRWWVAELDAARPWTGESEQPAGGLTVNSLDVPDPHVVGMQHHALAIDLVASSTAALIAGLGTVLAFPAP